MLDCVTPKRAGYGDAEREFAPEKAVEGGSGGDGGASGLQAVRKRCRLNSALLALAYLLAGVALGLAIWGAAEATNNSGDIDDLTDRVDALEAGMAVQGE